MATTKETSSGKKSATEVHCPSCGMNRDDWPEEGFKKDGELYCCRGCADGTGCTCAQA